MAYQRGNRDQLTMLPSCIEEYVGDSDPVRVYDAFIEALDIAQLGLVLEERRVGAPPYDPVSMLKLLVYGYSYGWRSSRKLERALYHNLSFIWLCGGLKPDHKTISEFRRNNKDVLKSLLKQCARLCIKLKLIEGNCLFLDGSKFRGNASINQTKSQKKWEELLEKVDERIDSLLEECESIDQQEEGSLVQLEEEFQDKVVLKSKIEDLLKTIKIEETKKINATDKECVTFQSRQGSHAGFNAQIVTDEKHGLIVNTDVVSESNDTQQFSNQIDQAQEVLEKPCQTACADAGFSNTEKLKEVVDQGIEVIVPSQKQAEHKPKDNPFSKEKFIYDSENNRYFCPEGKILNYSHYSKKKKHYLYRIAGPSNCLKCPHFGICTKNKRGRAIIRLKYEELKEQLEAHYASERGQEVYQYRKEKVEHQFGHMKRNLNAGFFLLRGLQGAKAEMAILGSCFNISRMITLLGGVPATIQQLKTL